VVREFRHRHAEHVQHYSMPALARMVPKPISSSERCNRSRVMVYRIARKARNRRFGTELVVSFIFIAIADLFLHYVLNSVRSRVRVLSVNNKGLKRYQCTHTVVTVLTRCPTLHRLYR
jgi:hypothetical protein